MDSFLLLCRKFSCKSSHYLANDQILRLFFSFLGRFYDFLTHWFVFIMCIQYCFFYLFFIFHSSYSPSHFTFQPSSIVSMTSLPSFIH